MSRSLRRDLLFALAVAGAVVLLLVARQGWPWHWGSSLGTLDWLAYWSVPRALLDGRGFYDIAWLTELQSGVGFESHSTGSRAYPTLRLWNPPPFVLPLLPFGGLSFSVASALWLTLSGALYGFAALRLGYEVRRGTAAWLLVVALFVSTLIFSLAVGQVVPFLTASFLFAWLALRRGQPIAVAALALPLLLKPHLFGPALVLLLASRWEGVAWARWAFAAFAVGLVVLATLLDPAWLAGWRAQGPPTTFQTVALGDLAARYLRLPEWGQFLTWPIGLLVALWRFRSRPPGDPRSLSEAAWLGVLASPYVWAHDPVLLLPVFIEIATARTPLRFALLLVPLAWWLPIPLAWLDPWMTGTAAEGRLGLLNGPIRFMLYITLLGALWLWVRWRSRAVVGRGCPSRMLR